MFFFIYLFSFVFSVDFIPYKGKLDDGTEVDIKCYKNGENSVTIGSGNIEEAAIDKQILGNLTLPLVTYQEKTYVITEIGSYAFYNSMISKITIQSANYTKIDSFAFYNCRTLTEFTIPDECTEIGAHAFDNAEISGKFTFGKGLQKLGDYAFYEASVSSFEQINNTKLESIPTYCFAKLKLSQEGRWDPLTLPATVASIGASSFAACNYLDNIKLPEKLATIGDQAFGACGGLESIDFTGTAVTDIPTDCFYECSALESVIFTDKIKTLGNSSFHGTGLKEVSISSSVTSIGSAVFQVCLNLKSADLENLTIVRLSDDLFQGSGLETVKLPKGLEVLGERVFKDSHLKQVTLPSTLKKIQHGCFSQCHLLTEVDMSNTNVETIEKYAFYNCYGINSLNLSQHLISVGEQSFANNSFTSIAFPSTFSKFDDSSFEKVPLASLDLSNTKVTEITNRCFAEASLAGGVTLGNVEVIGSSSFCFTGLTTLKLGNKVKKIDSNAFEFCTQLKEVDLSESHISEIGKSAFHATTALETIKWPEVSFAIGDGAFMGSGLKSITLDTDCASLGKAAFQSCKSLETVNMSTASAGTLPTHLFDDCTKLTTIALTDFLSSIVSDALPSSVKSIYYCGSTCFSGNFSTNATVYVPQSYGCSKFGSASITKLDNFPYPIDYHASSRDNGSNVGWIVAIVLVIVIAVAVAIYILYKKKFIFRHKQDENYLMTSDTDGPESKALFT